MQARGFKRLSLVGLLLLSGCFSASQPPAGDYSLDRVRGLESHENLSPAQYHSAIEVAYLDGQISKEEAVRAHRRIDQQGL
jgi:outer membrane murein-binding lipoprotein Lpp